MALARTLRDLTAAGRAVAARCRELRIAVSEDRPEPADLALLSRREDTAEDLLSAATEAANAIASAAAFYGDGQDREGGRSLAASQQLIDKLGRQLESELGGHRAMTEIEGLARQRGRAWAAWLGAVCRSLDECRRALEQAQDALIECWRDVADMGPSALGPWRGARTDGGLTLIGNEEGGGHDGTK